MATNLRILKNTNLEVVAKVDGSAGDVTIELADLALANEVIDPEGAARVNIVALHSVGSYTSHVSVRRFDNTDPEDPVEHILYEMSSEAAPIVNLLEFGGVTDSTYNDSDIKVTIHTSSAQLLLKLRKVSGYKTMIQTEQFSVYDDPESLTE